MHAQAMWAATHVESQLSDMLFGLHSTGDLLSRERMGKEYSCNVPDSRPCDWSTPQSADISTPHHTLTTTSNWSDTHTQLMGSGVTWRDERAALSTAHSQRSKVALPQWSS